MLADAEQAGPCANLGTGYGLEVVDLHLDGGNGPQAAKMAIDCDSDGRIGERRQHAAMESSVRVHQIRPERALDTDAVGVKAHHADAEKAVKRHFFDERVDPGQR